MKDQKNNSDKNESCKEDYLVSRYKTSSIRHIRYPIMWIQVMEMLLLTNKKHLH